jgi:hypothetical protein
MKQRATYVALGAGGVLVAEIAAYVLAVKALARKVLG